MMNDVKMLRVLVKVLRVMDESAVDAVQKVCKLFQTLIQTKPLTCSSCVFLLCQARDLQQKIVNRVRNEQPAQLDTQMKMLADVCCDCAHEFRLRLDLEMARRHYTDALNYSPENEEVRRFSQISHQT